MVKKHLFFLLLFFSFFALQAQIFDPVKWETSVNKISDNEYDLTLKAQLESNWHLYAQKIPDNGPIPTTISFEGAGKDFELIGETQEGEGHEAYDEVFEMDIKFFEEEAVFVQKVRLINSDITLIKGSVEFMVCDDKNCLPPTSEQILFQLKLSPQTSPIISDKNNNTVSGMAGSEDKEENKVKKEIKPQNTKKDKSSLWQLFFLSFIAGFAALLTPCVFPMIPMTVSFFTKQSKNRAMGIRNAIIYGISIIVLYVGLGTIITAIFGADSLNALSTNVWFNIIFFVLLVVFAISFLGAFEITLPSSWGTKVDSQADRGGFVGIFFMALALAIVSFSCTGPIVGTALVAAAAQGGIAPVISMFGFSLAIALPFALFAAFPGWLNSLPKSGGWLNTVKVVLGFLELALAFKFLSNADLVLQAHWLEREVFLAIWIAIFGALALYLLGKIKLPHDSDQNHISVGRLSFGLVVLAFTIYMVPGLWGAPLKLISGFPPPMQYSESPNGIGTGSIVTELGDDLPKSAHIGPHGIIAFLDYEEGLAFAKKVNKPAMIDFTGHACVNCRKMEEKVWSDPEVLNVLKNDLVLISLYVDDKRELPEDEQYESDITNKRIETIGNKWSEFQIKKYAANAQPYYVLIDHNGENLNEYSAYNPDIDEYLAWLNEGIGNFKSN
ncbi:protein-disulfide reductase DsbD family protein [Namhaeicola litoreus]|uniref:Protein-disulfide reductase DsbD family protein n=1 Tax=Namhaeicola litoreus TaxID=1052145 RepID=A0ABW3Y3A3_9FLAO